MTTSTLLGHRVRDRKARSREEEGRMPDRADRSAGRQTGRLLRAA